MVYSQNARRGMSTLGVSESDVEAIVNCPLYVRETKGGNPIFIGPGRHPVHVVVKDDGGPCEEVIAVYRPHPSS